MTSLPIVLRELRIRARWRSTYIVRTGMAVLAIAVTIVMALVESIVGAGIGKELLLTLGWVAFGFCVIEGLRSTADAISEEKREGTIGLLFLTDLRGYDIVLGKFAATSLSSLYGLLAIVPALAVPVLLGGVTGAEFWRVILALGNGLFFSLCLGMLVSVLSYRERKAWAATVALILVAVWLLPLAHTATGGLAFGALSPTTPMLNAFDLQYSGGGSTAFWLSLGLSHGASWTFLLLASGILPRVWQQRVEGGRSPGTGNEPGSQRRRMLETNPVWWLSSRRSQGHRRTLLLGLAGAGAAILLCGIGGLWTGWHFVWIAIAIHLAVTVGVAAEACYSFADARSSGALELLLSTPLPIRQIVRGQQLAIRDLFLAPVAVLIVAELVLLGFRVSLAAGKGSVFESIIIIIVMVLAMGAFVLDMLAVTRLGMWFSLTSAKPTHALTRTVLLVLILPALFLPCLSVLGPGLLFAKSMIFLSWAQTKLDLDFRAAAARPHDRPARRMPWSRSEEGKLILPE